MACPYNRTELKYKFPPCPCEKCVASRAERVAGGFCGTVDLPSDTPPERPNYEQRDYRDHSNKCDCKPKIIGPSYQIKYKSKRQPKKISSNDKKIQESAADDDRINKNFNLTIFLINVISCIALVLIAAIVFWLKMCYWTYILGVQVYNSNRTTQLTVLGLFGLLILCMCCTYAMGGRKIGAKVISAPSTSFKGPDYKANGRKFTDDEAREILEQTKLYSMPMEMKQPPAFFKFLRSFILEVE